MPAAPKMEKRSVTKPKPSNSLRQQKRPAKGHGKLASVAQSPTREAIDVCNALAASVELLSVNLVETNAKLLMSGLSFEDESLHLVVDSPQFMADVQRDKNMLLCGARFRLRITCNPEDSVVDFFEVFAEYVLPYRVPKDVACTDDGGALFASRNGVFNAWPFFRELAHSVAARMNFPSVVLPLLRLPLLPPK